MCVGVVKGVGIVHSALQQRALRDLVRGIDAGGHGKGSLVVGQSFGQHMDGYHGRILQVLRKGSVQLVGRRRVGGLVVYYCPTMWI
eukprot:scaffold10310_cov171-Amphora_coffeaeformis.AAC.13